jgi:hypothetical protein
MHCTGDLPKEDRKDESKVHLRAAGTVFYEGDYEIGVNYM